MLGTTKKKASGCWTGPERSGKIYGFPLASGSFYPSNIAEPHHPFQIVTPPNLQKPYSILCLPALPSKRTGGVMGRHNTYSPQFWFVLSLRL
jgi:hypothetical protein